MNIELRTRPGDHRDDVQVSHLTIDGNVVHPDAIEWTSRRGTAGFHEHVFTLAIPDIAAALIDEEDGMFIRVDGASFRELEHALVAKADQLRSSCDQQEPDQRAAARDFSLAITALEDAGIRFTRGLASLKGVLSYVNVDLERMEAEARAAVSARLPDIDFSTREPGGEAGDDTGAGGS